VQRRQRFAAPNKLAISLRLLTANTGVVD